MTLAATNRLLVLEADTPWIWNLFAALPEGWQADRCGPVSAGVSPRRWREATAAGHVPVPGWTRVFGLSTALLARRVAARLRSNRYRAIVHTIPWTAGLLDRFRDVPHVYRPHDYFGMYSWNQKRVRILEGQLLAGCRLVLPISAAQADDFRKDGDSPIRVLPNAVTKEFVQRLRGPMPVRPADLPTGKPVVGCIGQINRSYDFALALALASAVPEAAFVYIGPVLDDDPGVKRQIDALFACSNVTWLGKKPHEQLPDYLRHFDVCFNPLQPTDWNHRRSPLRLYDYLAAGKPVLSTNVAAARSHEGHVESCTSASEAKTHLRSMLAPDYHIDELARQQYVDANTWNERARQLVGLIDEFCR